MSDMININGNIIPKEDITCPGCGRMYNHHKTKICKKCEECSKCCKCEPPEYISLIEFVENLFGGKCVK